MTKRETISLPKNFGRQGEWQEVDELLNELRGDLRTIVEHRAASPPALRTLEVDIGLVLEIHSKLDRLRDNGRSSFYPTAKKPWWKRMWEDPVDPATGKKKERGWF